MPSPFPGMDPYLEDPHFWPGVHMQLVSEMQAALNRVLLPRYYAAAEDRVYISDEDDLGRKVIGPDVRIVPTGSKKKPAVARLRKPAATRCEPVTVTLPLGEEVHEPYLRVVEHASQQVVTVIEVLSPANKVGGARGRAEYTAKRAEVLASETNWVEIDLLRAGEPVLARQLYPECEYTVHVSRAAQRPKVVVWPIRLQQRLPVLPIPLKGAEPDAELDLQGVVAGAYDRGAFAVRLDYTAEPVPLLPPDLARWANKLLKQKKLR
jgi:hypothetical protein